MAERARQKLVSSRQVLEEELTISGGEGALLTKARNVILSQKPMELLKNLREGKVSVVSVLEAFQAKAIEESKRTNCITGFIKDAKQYAEELDSSRSSTQLQKMPLFGMPLSVKDMISVKGMDTTMGLVKRVDVPSGENAVFVEVMKNLGAVPFVMTNVPQLCMSIGCKNPVFGETLNPIDTSRSPGGSSGGEGALIGGGGSFLGLGTDLGGSVRIPSHWCGIVCIKPTTRRATGRGLVAPSPPIPGVYGTTGIMGKDAPIVVEATKAFYSLDHSQFDVEIPPVEWRDYLFSGSVEMPLKEKLRIGYYTELSKVPPTPGVVRSVLESVEILKELGHELVPFVPPEIEKVNQLWYELALSDGGRYATEILKGEEVEQTLKFYLDMASATACKTETVIANIEKQYGKVSAKLIGTTKTPADLWEKLFERMMYVGQFTSVWKQHNLDLLLTPGWPIPAPPKDLDASMLGTLGVYSLMYNVLDFPAAVMPVTKENQQDQKLLESYTLENKSLEKLVKSYTKGSVGMPLGVQFVALPFCEEILCRIMLEFSKAVDYKP